MTIEVITDCSWYEYGLNVMLSVLEVLPIPSTVGTIRLKLGAFHPEGPKLCILEQLTSTCSKHCPSPEFLMLHNKKQFGKRFDTDVPITYF